MSSLTRLKLSSGADRAMFIVALGIMAAVSPMATDIYLASIPAAAEYFRTPITAVQLSLSTYMIGMALGQLVLGPVSDRLGRYGLIVTGTSVFTLSSAGIALSTSIEMMLVLRAVQGVAGAAGVVVGRAMVSDTVSGIEAAKVYTLLGTITSMAPIVAPLIGGVIASQAVWQTVFWLLTGFGLLMLTGTLVVLKETLPPAERSRAGLVGIFEGPWRMLGQAEARHRAGAGSAVLGLLQFLLGGIASPLSGLGGDSTAVPMALWMLIFSGLALICAVTALRLSRRADAD